MESAGVKRPVLCGCCEGIFCNQIHRREELSFLQMRKTSEVYGRSPRTPEKITGFLALTPHS
jgi:hypothetical protein